MSVGHEYMFLDLWVRFVSIIDGNFDLGYNQSLIEFLGRTRVYVLFRLADLCVDF
jgi:hypothetical protein